MNAERRAKIKEVIMSKPFISFSELMEMFPQYSGMTIRRDIEFFEKQGDIIKVRGGARSMKFIKNSSEETFTLRSVDNLDAKEKICKKALDFIEPGRSVFIDSGTTMLKFTEMLPDIRYTVTTSAPNIAIELLHYGNIMINIVGGMLNKDNISISGKQAMEFISSINIDTAFIVPSGYSLETGFTCGNYNECEFKSFLIEKARRKILLADASKFNRIMPYSFANIEDINVLITNFIPDIEMKERINTAGIELYTV